MCCTHLPPLHIGTAVLLKRVRTKAKRKISDGEATKIKNKNMRRKSYTTRRSQVKCHKIVRDATVGILFCPALQQ